MPVSTARKRLSPDSILQTARKLLRKKGVAGLSIRNLADELGVTPMAIYRHFENKDALLSALFDQFIRAADVLPNQPLPWDDWILHVGQRMWAAQVAEPDWITLLGSIQLRSGGLGVMLDSLDVLTEAGFSREDALQGFFAMVHCCVGASCVSQGIKQLDLNKALDQIDVDNLARLQNQYGSVNEVLQAQALENSLRLLIDGLRIRL